MNKFLSLFIFLLLLSIRAYTQSFYGSQYIAGRAVNDSITTTPLSDPGPSGCYPAASWTVNFPPSKVKGVKNYMLITAVSPGTSEYTTQIGALHVGDTLPFTTDVPSYDFYFPTGGGIVYSIRAMGTPKNEGESYSCGQFIETTSATGCPDVVTYTFIQTGKVLASNNNLSPMSVRIMPIVNLSVYSFSTSATVMIDKSVNLTDGRFEFYDTYGRKTKTIPVNEHEFTLDRKGLSDGIYFWKVICNNQTIGLGKLTITQL